MQKARKVYEFPCGCKFKVIQEEPLRLSSSLDIENIPLDCQRTWDLISSGNTIGCFQLESQLAQTYCKKVKPRNIRELSDIISIIRPGCLDAIFDKKNVTNHYVDRKNAEEEVVYLHPSLESILGETYGLIIYQEQALKIAQIIAGFDPGESEQLRKSIGKKLADLMAKLKTKFIDGCERVGFIDKESAGVLFSNIEASQRYSFNLSHSISYALTAYMTAYFKAHFPRAFFTSYLYYAKDKQKPREEIFDLVQNARIMDIDVYPPDFRLLNADFILHEKNIYFGFVDIKGIGDSVIKQLNKEVVETEKEIGRPVKDWNWLDFLLFFAPHVKSPAIKGLICAGALDYFKIARTRMYFEYEKMGDLVEREMDCLRAKHIEHPSLTLNELLSCLINTPTGRKGGGCSSGRRLESVKSILEVINNPPFALEDSIVWLAGVEEEMMGISLTCTEVDDCDIEAANCTCRDFIKGYKKPGPILIACKINRVKDITTKNKKRMGFLSVGDITGSIDSVVLFPNVWVEYGDLCREGNTIMIQGKRSDKEKDNFMVDKVWQL